jgi:hypothetical protein
MTPTPPENYEIESGAGSDPTEVEHTRCIGTIKEGGAVDTKVAADELPLAGWLEGFRDRSKFHGGERWE